MTDLLASRWQQMAEARANRDWADFSDDSRSIDDSRSMGDLTNGASMGSEGTSELYQVQRVTTWSARPVANVFSGAAPTLTVTNTDESDDGFISPTGRASRRSRGRGIPTGSAPRRTQQQQPAAQEDDQLFELLAGDSRTGFNAAFKAGFSLSGADSNDASALVDETSNGDKKRPRGALPGSASGPSQRGSKLPRSALSADVSSTSAGQSSEQQVDEVMEERQRAPRATRSTSSRRRGMRVLTAAAWAAASTPDAADSHTEVEIGGSPAMTPLSAPEVQAWSESQAAPPLSWAAVVEPSTSIRSEEQFPAQNTEEEEADEGKAAALASDAESEEGDGQRGRTETRETDEHRLAQRQRQITIGKNSEEYVRYCALFPPGTKAKRRAKTPDKYQICSKRSFDGQISKWRRQLHAEVGDSSDSGIKTRAQRATKAKTQKPKPRVDSFFG